MQTRSITSLSIQAGTLLGLLCLTLKNVEMRWSEADLTLAQVLPWIGGIGFVCLSLNRKAWHWTWIDTLAGIWMGYWLLRVWIGAEYPCGTSFLHTAWMCLLYIVLRLVFTGCGKSGLYILALFILLFGTMESAWGFWQMLNGSSRHGIYLLTGNFLNPGPYSAYPMMGAVAGISLLNANHNPNLNYNDDRNALLSKIKIIIETLTLLCLMILPATWSRAAWISVGMIVLWVLREKYWKWRWLIWGGLAALAIVVFLVKQGSAEGRLIIWAAALTSWWNVPLIGVGYGGFCHAVAEGISTLYNHDASMFSNFQNAGVTEYSYNALLQILVEQGAVGALLCLLTIALVIMRLHKVCPPLMYCLLSLLIFSCFSYPFEMLPYRIILVLIMALTASYSMSESRSHHHIWIPILFGCAAIGISLPLGKETEERLACDEDAHLITSSQDNYFLKDLYSMVPQNRDNPTVLFSMAKMLQDKGRWRDSNAFLQMGTEVSTDPMFYVLQGNNYQELGWNDLAEQSYLKAFSVMPNRHYPLYKLMCLYQDAHQESKATEIAEQIIAMKPKIQSPATDEMQQKAKEYLDSANLSIESCSCQK